MQKYKDLKPPIAYIKCKQCNMAVSSAMDQTRRTGICGWCRYGGYDVRDTRSSFFGLTYNPHLDQYESVSAIGDRLGEWQTHIGGRMQITKVSGKVYSFDIESTYPRVKVK